MPPSTLSELPDAPGRPQSQHAAEAPSDDSAAQTLGQGRFVIDVSYPADDAAAGRDGDERGDRERDTHRALAEARDNGARDVDEVVDRVEPGECRPRLVERPRGVEDARRGGRAG